MLYSNSLRLQPTSLHDDVAHLDLNAEHDANGALFTCGCVWPAIAPFSPESSDSSGSEHGSDDELWDCETLSGPEWDSETLTGSESATATATPQLGTPQIRVEELLDEAVPFIAREASGSVTRSSSHHALGLLRVPHTNNGDVFKASLTEALGALASQEPVPLAPLSTPASVVPRISPENEAKFAKVLSDSLALLAGKPVAAAPARDVDRLHLAMESIPFPSMGFDIPLAAHPAVKAPALGRLGGAGRSGFSNSFAQIAARDRQALVSQIC